MKIRERFMSIGQALMMPLFFTSNALYSIAIMPWVMQCIVRFNPMSYIVDAVRSLMITGDLMSLPIDLQAYYLGVHPSHDTFPRGMELNFSEVLSEGLRAILQVIAYFTVGMVGAALFLHFIMGWG
ncbi:MAG: ABC transporter permease [Candidatus Korarchaeum sp.]